MRRFLVHSLLVGRRECRLLLRSRSAGVALGLLVLTAWLPLLLVSLRRASLAIPPLSDVAILTLALIGLTLPLLVLLAGADALAGEIEDGTLVPLLTLPIVRSACGLGKFLGRALLLAIGYGVGFGSAFAVMALVHGSGGARDYASVVGAGGLLSLSCLGIGLALGAGGRGRLRSFGLALLAWLVLVFALDTIFLATIVALAPPAPSEVGGHGHGELPLPIHDRHGADAAGDDDAVPGLGWLMTLSPVDLYRLTILSGAPGLRARFEETLPGVGANLGSVLVGWAFWLAAPPALALRRFRRARLLAA